MLSIFSCISWPSACLLWRNVYLGLLPIFWQGCLCFGCWATWVVYKFCRLIPYQLQFANFFSHSMGCLFVLFVISFAVQKLLSLMRSHLFILVLFTQLYSENGSEKILLCFMSKSVLPMFSSKSFIQFSQHRLLKTLSFLHCIV